MGKKKSNSAEIPFAAVKDGKLSLDVPAQVLGWKNEAERANFKTTHPNEYAVTGGAKIDTNILSRNYKKLDSDDEKLLKTARKQDEYYKKYGVLDFAKNYYIDGINLQKEIDVLSEKIKSVKKSDKLSKNLVLDTNTRKNEINKVNSILYEYGCKDIDELKGLLESKKQAKEFWEHSHTLAKMSSVGDINSENYDPKFDEWSNIGKKLIGFNKSAEQLAPHQAVNPVEAVRSMYYEYIGNISDLSQRIATNLADDSMDQIAAILQMTEEQVKIYNYYLGKEYYNEVEDGTADRYLEYLKTQYNENTADIIQKELKNNPFFQYAYSGHAGKQRFEDNMKNLGDYFKKDTYRAETTSQKASKKIRQDIVERDGVIGQIGYDMIDTVSYQLPAILASTVAEIIVPGSGVVVGAGLNGVSATSGAYTEARRKGFDEKQSRFYSLGIGASEAALSYTIGGISKLGGKISGNVIKEVANSIDNGIAKFALQYGSKLLFEGLEESLQEALDPIFKSLATNTSMEYWGGVDWKSVTYSALLGALSSGVFELSESISTNIKDNKLNSNEVIDGMWEDAPNTSKYNVEKSELKSVENYDENGIIKAGGKITDINYLNADKYELQARKYYAERIEDFSDVDKISKNTGFSIEDISKIKKHMMIDDIKFKDGSIRKFDPDIDQALAWKRLIDGNSKKTDILLLNHELEELRIIDEKNLDYEDAHRLANEKYNWEKAVQNIFDDDELY